MLGQVRGKSLMPLPLPHDLLITYSTVSTHCPNSLQPLYCILFHCLSYNSINRRGARLSLGGSTFMVTVLGSKPSGICPLVPILVWGLQEIALYVQPSFWLHYSLRLHNININLPWWQLCAFGSPWIIPALASFTQEEYSFKIHCPSKSPKSVKWYSQYLLVWLSTSHWEN